LMLVTFSPSASSRACEFRKFWPVPFRKFCPVPG
jgi:hypothetical protein